jgi:hypothetical protein
MKIYKSKIILIKFKKMKILRGKLFFFNNRLSKTKQMQNKHKIKILFLKAELEK